MSKPNYPPSETHWNEILEIQARYKRGEITHTEVLGAQIISAVHEFERNILIAKQNGWPS